MALPSPAQRCPDRSVFEDYPEPLVKVRRESGSVEMLDLPTYENANYEKAKK
jgi:hypothetical protein